MTIWEHMQGLVIFLLMVLPFVGIGYVAGMLHMRANYLELLRRARIETGRAMRYAEQRATNERRLGFAIGYRQASAWRNGGRAA